MRTEGVEAPARVMVLEIAACTPSKYTRALEPSKVAAMWCHLSSVIAVLTDKSSELEPLNSNANAEEEVMRIPKRARAVPDGESLMSARVPDVVVDAARIQKLKVRAPLLMGMPDTNGIESLASDAKIAAESATLRRSGP